MIYKGVKYACGTCIKGHRSSNCNHVERPLFEIRKKGRPVTQCSFCRDLRKTKQVHIKCACSHKSAKEQQPILIYQTEESSVVPEVPEVVRDKCTCSDLNHDHHLPIKQEDAGGLLSHTSSMMTGGIGTQQQQQQQLVDSNSFSWAVVTPTPEESLFANDENVNLGFIFHKSSSQRFLEGQPRPPRKKSMKKQPTSSSSPRAPSPQASSTTMINPTNTTTAVSHQQQQQQNFMLPLMDLDLPSSSSSTCSDNNLSPDLAMILNNVLKPLQEFRSSDEDVMNQELANLDLTPTNGNMIYPTTSTTCHSTPGTPPHPLQQQQQQQPYFQQQLHSSSSSSSSPSYFSQPMLDSTTTGNLGFDQVGSCTNVNCRSDHSGPGESVVITIAPLSATTHNPLQGSDNVRTRIVTCYCAGHCACPGCLVHPGNFLMGGADPYRGLSSTGPSSTASSIYSNSDDEDQQQQQQPSILL